MYRVSRFCLVLRKGITLIFSIISTLVLSGSINVYAASVHQKSPLTPQSVSSFKKSDIVLDEIYAIGPKQFQLFWKSHLPFNVHYQVCLYDEQLATESFCQPLEEKTTEQGANVSLKAALLTDEPVFFILATNAGKTYTSNYVHLTEYELTQAIGQHYLPNESHLALLGTKLAMSGNGQVMAVIGESYERSYLGHVASTENNIHIVYLYQRDPLGWQLQTRLPFTGDIDLDMSLDYLGQNLVVSRPDHQTYDLQYQKHSATGVVKHFSYKNGTWQINQVLHNGISEANTYELDDTYFGHKVMLSQNGKVLLVTGIDPSYAQLGSVVYVYRYVNEGWRLEETLSGDFSNVPLFELSLDLAQDGRRIAISDPHDKRVIIYDFQSIDSNENKGTWQQTGVIEGHVAGFAEQLSLNGTGHRLAVAAVDEVHFYDEINGHWQLNYQFAKSFKVFTKMSLAQDGLSLYFSVPQGQFINLDRPLLKTPVVVQFKQINNKWQLTHLFDMQDSSFSWDFVLDASGHNLVIGGGKTLDKFYHY
ncbi:hypothetical protein [uncultured Shewanella sp.]|uniref:hypothetical protein n=1 Tax=uncultured Shewanella sp. TaxID=173975 RepID=UPI002631F276|nr:hypothetical protein [uncultured Shewanella sp.]